MNLRLTAITLLWIVSGACQASYETVYRAVFSAPYKTLPHYVVDKKLFGRGGTGTQNALYQAALRTLTSNADLIDFAKGQKLFQPNGICFAAHWRIDKKTDFTGLFAAPAAARGIVRISVMLSGTNKGEKRAFAMAIKLFPQKRRAGRSLNLLMMASMGGAYIDHASTAVMDNEPALGSLPRLSDWGTALRIRKDLARANTTVAHGVGIANARIQYRSVAHAAALGVTDENLVHAPEWLRLRVVPDTPRIDAQDFRDELSLRNYPDGKLIYEIEVAGDHAAGKAAAHWQPIGHLELHESITSPGCDRRLHFQHPLH